MALKDYLQKLLNPAGSAATPLERLTLQELEDHRHLLTGKHGLLVEEIGRLQSIRARVGASAFVGGPGAPSAEVIAENRQHMDDLLAAKEEIETAIAGVADEIEARKIADEAAKRESLRKASAGHHAAWVSHTASAESQLVEACAEFLRANQARGLFLESLPSGDAVRFPEIVRSSEFVERFQQHIAAHSESLLGRAHALLNAHEMGERLAISQLAQEIEVLLPTIVYKSVE